MKKRIINILIVMFLLVTSTACSDQDDIESTNDAVESTDGTSSVQPNTVYTGTVTAISTTSITISTSDGDVTIELTDSTTFSAEFVMGEIPPDMGEIPPDMGEIPSDMGEIPPDMGEIPPDMGEIPPDMGEIPSDMGEIPPDIPQGEMGGINNDEIPPMSGETPNITITDISIGNTVNIETDNEGKAASVTVTIYSSDMNVPGQMQQPDNMGQIPGNMNGGVDSYDAATEFTNDTVESGTDYSSTKKDENTIHIYNGANVTIKDSTITRESADSTGGDNSSFYGIGAATLVTDGTLTIENSTITTNADGGAGVFAYGDGTAYVINTTIDTSYDTSGGIHVAGGGTLYAWDLTIETDGESSAAIRSDRGSGTIVVDGGTYVSNGVGSPVIYSAADITINNASLTSNGSEAICIEGLNSIRLFDCDLSGDMKDLNQNDCTWNVILYQSMSGDSQIGNSTFEMVGGTLTAGNGGMFYTTNTESTFIISNVDITYAKDSEFFLKCTGNANQRGWGTSGKNGADCNFTAIAQAMEGNVIWDSISRLDLYILKGSTFTGAVINDETNAGNGGDGYATLYIDESSNWIVTGDSTLTNLHCAETILDAEGNTVTIVGTDGNIYVQGNSQYTITVDSYDNTVNTSNAHIVESWSDFSVAKP